MSGGATEPTGAERVVLADERPFSIGIVQVEPNTRQVFKGAVSETLEPRVMQVLVVLATRSPMVISRDEMIDRCWDGRIVTDDAINRVLSRLRQVALGFAEGSFTIETIARVGYRLIEQPVEDRVLPFPVPTRVKNVSQTAINRRRLLVKGATLASAVGCVGALGWWQPWKRRVSPASRQLTERGKMMMREGLGGQIRQAVTYLERAVAIDPENSEAWGQLALAYSHMLQGFDPTEGNSLPQRIRAAANRALSLDTRNPDARLALIYMTPLFGRWAEKEKLLRVIVDEFPQHWLARGRLAVLLYQVGRMEEGMASHNAALEVDPLLPVPNAYRIFALSALGRIQEADAALDEALLRWSGHPLIWLNGFRHFLFSGRAETAAVFASDPRRRPSTFPDDLIAWNVRLARAIGGGSLEERAAVVRQLQKNVAEDLGATPFAAPPLVALGREDLSIEVLARYFDGGAGSRLTATDFLFAPPLRALTAHGRFRALTQRTGLEEYWRSTGSRPDA